MTVFWRLVLGHLLADFTFQTNAINAWKRRSLAGLLVHCAMHPFFYALLAAPWLGETWVAWGAVRMTGWACVGAIFAAHFAEDLFRVRAVEAWGYSDNTLFFAWDQAVHYASIFVFAPFLFEKGTLFPERWVMLAILAVLVTHFGTVLLYFVEKDLWGRDFPNFDVKYFGMAERLVVLLLFLAESPWALLGVPVWIGAMAHLRRRRLLDMSAFSFYGGMALAVLAGAAARLFYYG